MGVLLFQIGQKRSNFNLSLKIAQILRNQRSEFFWKMQHCASPAQSIRQDGLRAKCRFLKFARKIPERR